MNRTVAINDTIDEMYAMSRFWGKGSNDAQRDEMKGLLKNAMDSVLTARQKSCLSKYYFERKTEKQIGEELGLDISTVSRHIKAARRNLKKLRGLV